MDIYVAIDGNLVLGRKVDLVVCLLTELVGVGQERHVLKLTSLCVGNSETLSDLLDVVVVINARSQENFERISKLKGQRVRN